MKTISYEGRDTFHEFLVALFDNRFKTRQFLTEFESTLSKDQIELLKEAVKSVDTDRVYI